MPLPLDPPVSGASIGAGASSGLSTVDARYAARSNFFSCSLSFAAPLSVLAISSVIRFRHGSLCGSPPLVSPNDLT